MNSLISILHWICGLVILAEALNKLEYCDPLRRGLTHYARLIDVLKALAWGSLAIGAGGAVISPALDLIDHTSQHVPDWMMDQATLVDTSVLFGFAVLIIRTRIREIEGGKIGVTLQDPDTSPDKLTPSRL